MAEDILSQVRAKLGRRFWESPFKGTAVVELQTASGVAKLNIESLRCVGALVKVVRGITHVESHLKWRVHPKYGPYTVVLRKSIYLHRLVVGLPPRSLVVVRQSADKMDTTLVNLRVEPTRWVALEKSKPKRKYRGVFPHRDTWAAQVRKDGVDHWCGKFKSPRQAALAYDRKVRELFGPVSWTNKKLGLL